MGKDAVTSIVVHSTSCCLLTISIVMQRRLAAAGTAASGGTRADVPSAAKRELHCFPEGAIHDARSSLSRCSPLTGGVKNTE